VNSTAIKTPKNTMNNENTRSTIYCVTLVCVADTFDYCGSLFGEKYSSARNVVAATSAKRNERRDGKTPITQTTGRNGRILRTITGQHI